MEASELGVANLMTLLFFVPVVSLLVFIFEPKTWPILAFFVFVVNGGIALRCVYLKRIMAREGQSFYTIMLNMYLGGYSSVGTAFVGIAFYIDKTSAPKCAIDLKASIESSLQRLSSR